MHESPSSVVQVLLKGLAASFLSQALSALELFGLVPLFLSAWTAEVYGGWIALSAVVSYLTLLNLGGQEYIANLATMAFSQGNIEEFREHLSQGLSLFACICTTASLALGVFAALRQLDPNASSGSIVNEGMILFFLGTGYLVSIFGGVFATAYRSTGRFFRGVMLGNIWAVIRLIILATALLLRVTPLGYSLVLLLITAVRTAFYSYDIIRVIPELNGLNLSWLEAWKGRKLLRGSLLFWIQALAQSINLQAIIQVLAHNVSAVSLSLYSTHKTASGLSRYPFNLLQGPIIPEMSKLGGREEILRIRKLAIESMKLCGLTSSIIGSIILIWLPQLYSIWTGRQLLLNPTLLLIFLIQSTLFCYWSSLGWSLLAVNRMSSLVYVDMLNAIVSVILAVFFVREWGIIGVAIASLTGDVLVSFISYPFLLARYIQTSSGQLFLTLTGSALASLLLLLITAFVNRTIVSNSAILVVETILVLGIGYVMFRFLLSREMVRLVESKVSSIIGLMTAFVLRNARKVR